ncbi:hypothetical protein [Mycobacterium sp.]|uniref:hypothetical protein n=1 Tax=Mycobacterium sp. TaxID=1785 RepID=UPI002C725A30|nr:hypothetical protein [Mycobacterium sp.]HTQ21487.1 hypothetical protein [Mycobacterium sp.]
MTNNRVLVTAATGKVGSAVTAQLLEKGVPTRAMLQTWSLSGESAAWRREQTAVAA